jgi:multidrug efflux pump
MTDTAVQQEAAPDEHYLKSAPITRAIMHLCIPMMTAMGVGTIYNVINAYFVGTTHDTSLLAALSFGLPLTVVMMAVGGVFGAGGSAYIARLLGGKNRQAIGEVSAFTLWGSLLTGALVSVLGLIFLVPIVHLLGTDPSSLVATTDYVRTLLYFTPVLIVAFAVEQLVRATGATRQSMIGLLIGTVANLVFDVVFILGLQLGVVGAAMALGLSNVLAIIYYLIYLRHAQPEIRLTPRALRINGTLLKEVLGVGSSELIQSGFILVSALILNHVAVQYGPQLLAAFGLSMRITQLPEALTMGIGLGMLPLFAYAQGAGDHKRLRAALRGAVIWIASLTVFFGAVVFLLREHVFALFTTDPKLLTDGTMVLSAMLVSTLFNGFTGLIMAYFQGTGRAKAAAGLGLAMGGIFIPAILLGQLWFGELGVVWSLTVSEAVACLLGLILIRFARVQAVPSEVQAEISPEAAVHLVETRAPVL